MIDDFGFSVGTRVVLVEKDPHNYVELGDSGVVCHVVDQDYFSDGCNIGVRWDKKRSYLHNCNGHCEPEHGRYVPHGCLRAEELDLGEIEVNYSAVGMLFGVT